MREDKPGVTVDDKPQRQSPTDDAELPLQKPDTLEDVSDVSDCVPEALHQPDSEDRDSSPVNWDTDTSEAHPPTEPTSRKSPSVIDDSSSTCSTDSLPSVVMNGPPSKGNSHQSPKTQKSPGRGKVKRGKTTGEVSGRANGMHQPPSGGTSEAPDSNVARSCKVDELESNAVVRSVEDRIQRLEHHMVKKEDVVKDEVAPERPPSSPPKTSPLAVRQKFDLRKSQQSDPPTARKPSPDTTRHPISNPAENLFSHKTGPQKPMGNPSSAPERPTNGQRASATEKSVDHPVSRTAEKARFQAVSSQPMVPGSLSRPLSAPLVPGSRSSATAPVVSTVRTAPVLSRSVSAAGRLGPDPSPVTQSYRNAMMGNPTPAAFSPNSTVGSSPSHPHPSTVPAPMFVPRTPERGDSSRPRFPFGPVSHDVLPNGLGPAHGRSNGTMVDEFPHLDIINDLLDDEHVAEASPMFRSLTYGPRHLTRQFTFPGDIGAPLDQGPSTSSCRYSYDSGPSAGPFDLSRETMPQQPSLYVNGHIDGLMHRRQWPMGGSDLSYLGLRHVDGDGYRYPDYPNVVMGVNVNGGYGVYRPSNGW